MTCTCRNCGFQVGHPATRSGIGMMFNFGVPIIVAAFVLPFAKRMSRNMMWEEFRFYLLGFLVFGVWLVLRFWFTSVYSWLWFTLFKRCPHCKKRHWSLGECSGFGL